MIITIFVIATFCLGVGFAVLGTNPSRFANQMYFLVTLVVTVWLWSVGEAMLVGARFAYDPSANPLVWIQINGAASGFVPWMVFLLSEAVRATPRRQAFRQAMPFLLLGCASGLVCFTDAYLPAGSSPLRPMRGPAYTFYYGLYLLLEWLLVVHIYRLMQRERGVRRVEMQFLVLNTAITFPLMLLVSGLGNLVRIPGLKYVSFAFILTSYILSAWALTFHRVYDLRQIFVSLGQRVCMVCLLAVGTWVGTSILDAFVPPPAHLLLSIVVCSSVVLWADRKTRRWLDLRGIHRLEAIRNEVTSLARTEPDTTLLVRQLEKLLELRLDASSATLLIDRGDALAGDAMELRHDSPALMLLHQMVWATPEGLDRGPGAAGTSELLEFFRRYQLSLAIAVPAGSPKSSLAIVLGAKRNRWPFTYPEVERVREIATTIDNILVRSRLIAEEGLKTKVDHLAMMSRGLAHDLKNLITPISAFLVHTTGRYAPGSAEEEVHTAARRSVAIITDYVNEALLFARRLTPNFQRVRVQRIFALVVEITHSRAARRNVSITTDIHGVDEFSADVVLIQRMLANLTNNAVDASVPGSAVNLTASPGAGGTIRLTVSDQGAGISPEHSQHIFEPYFTTKQFGDDKRGFGLGLTISDKIVALHRGTISVKSEVGIGTTIVVELPLDQPALIDGQPPRSVSTPPFTPSLS
ncbi:HAMP domain-containing sensor histidine kinase [Opitutus sp. ER46]|uniref:sensor histidine kinase n=1 Tax=Opitutus sp. ER46 TaxID=2161864 RepID=UPI000D304D9F|nr:HAMP domain-containing sensor histidine kinase [Opitutus sp. ER46]PTY00499.1 hypothetical protein DB354_01275 [Opitutus sp. ER46]